MLNLIIGSSGSGKSYYCHKSIEEDIKLGKKVILFVPEQFSHETEKSMLRLLGHIRAKSVLVLTFKKLSNILLKEVGGAKYKYINKASKAMIIYNIISNLSEELESFGNSVRGIGFTNIIIDLLSEIKMYDVSYEMLIEYSLNNDIDDSLRRKLRDIAKIYEKYEKNIEGKYLDGEDELNIIYEKLIDYDGIDNCNVYMDEFFFFTPQQLKIIEVFLKKAEKVTITLPQNRNLDEDVFRNVTLTKSKLIRICEKLQVNNEDMILCNKKGKSKFISDELIYLENNFYMYPFKKWNNKVEDIKIFKSINLFGECEYIATEIIRLVRDEGYRFRDIAVVTGDLDQYEKNLRVIFEQYNIPFYLDKKMAMIENPFVIFINSILDILEDNWRYESMFRYLKTGFLELDRDSIDKLENYVLKRGVKGKKWKSDFISLDETEEEIKELNRMRKIIITPIISLQKKIREDNSIKGICKSLFIFLEEVSITKRLGLIIEEFKLSGELDKYNEYSEITRIVIEILDKMVESFGEEKKDLRRFRQLLQVAFEQYEIGIIPPSIDQVLIGDVSHVRTSNIKALLIIGCNEDVFPIGAGHESVIGDDERIILRNMGMDLAPTSIEKIIEDQYLVYKTLSIPSNKLTITYSISDSSGKSRRQSIIVNRLKKIFTKIIEESNIEEESDDADFFRKINSDKATFNNLMLSYRQLKRNEKWKEVETWFTKNEKWKFKYNNAIKGMIYKNKNRKIGKNRIKELYGHHITFNPSRLESYSRCAFSYFIDKGLKAKERYIYEFSAPDMGTLMHETLNKFSNNVLKNNKLENIDKLIVEKEIKKILEEILDNKKYNILKSSKKYEYMLKRITKTIIRSANIIVYHFKSSDFVNWGTEVSIGENQKIPEIKFELPSGEIVYLNGQIDRIDTLEAEGNMYIRIIDYKSSTKNINLSDIYYNIQIQLIMYLDMILKNSEKFSKGKVIPGAILYFKMDDPFITGSRTMTESEIEKGIIKKLKMKGLLLKDAKIIRHMDKNISGYSLIIPANMNKSNEIGKSSSAITEEDFMILREYVNSSISNICEELISGVVDVKPLKSDKDCACIFCKFKSICAFDTEIDGNEYRNAKKISEKDALEKMKLELEK